MQKELTPEQKALVDACAQATGNAMKAGMHPAEALLVMQQCTAELESLQPLLLQKWQAGQPGSATQRAMERMAQQPGGGTLQDLMQFMADAGATVIVSDEEGTRQVQPEAPDSNG